MKYQVLFSAIIKKDVAKFVSCCSRDIGVKDGNKYKDLILGKSDSNKHTILIG